MTTSQPNSTGDGNDNKLALPSVCDWHANWPPMLERTRPDAVFALWGLWDAARSARQRSLATRRHGGVGEHDGSAPRARASRILTARRGTRRRRNDAVRLGHPRRSYRRVQCPGPHRRGRAHPGVVSVIDMDAEINQPGRGALGRCALLRGRRRRAGCGAGAGAGRAIRQAVRRADPCARADRGHGSAAEQP